MYHPFAFNKQDIRSIPISLITESTIDFLVVGGGGAGGFRTGGGGGAGGYITSVGNSGGGQSQLSSFSALIAEPYQISIGAGGAAFNTQTPNTPTSGSGTYSRFDAYLAEGGGRGGIGYDPSPDLPVNRNGQPGGSGGGGGSWQFSGNYASGSGGTGSAYYGGPYGYNGGSGSVGTGFRRGGGGGGAGAVGENALPGSSYLIDGADGGVGISGGPEPTPIYRAGGGGGGQTATGDTPITASGGLGGGGRGGTTAFLAGNGVDFTGGGGGGGASGVGGNGGSGVIILRYNGNEITASVTAGVTKSEEVAGNFKILTVTAAVVGQTITFTPI